MFSRASMDQYPVRDRWVILDVWGRIALRKVSSPLMSGTLMLTVRGTAPERSRHKGTNLFQSLPIDVQFLGLEVMALRQYRQTRVRETIGRGLVLETKVAHSAITSGGRRFTGRREFLKVITSCRTSLARSSRASTCEAPRQNPWIPEFVGLYLSCQRGH